MPRGRLRVRTNGRRDTVFEVHSWPGTSRWPRVCSSVCAAQCAQRAAIPTLSPEWRKADDADKIGERLSSRDDNTSGQAKGRVLYLFDQRIGGHHVSAAALLHRETTHLIQLYRVCFNDTIPTSEHGYASVRLVTAAKALAVEAAAVLEVLLPPNAQAHDVTELLRRYGLQGGTRKGLRGEIWMRSSR